MKRYHLEAIYDDRYHAPITEEEDPEFGEWVRYEDAVAAVAYVEESTLFEVLDAVDRSMTLERAVSLSEMWEAGKLIGGDSHAACLSLLREMKRLRVEVEQLRDIVKKGRAAYSCYALRSTLPGDEQYTEDGQALRREWLKLTDEYLRGLAASHRA